jgi:hypothetical protein
MIFSPVSGHFHHFHGLFCGFGILPITFPMIFLDFTTMSSMDFPISPWILPHFSPRRTSDRRRLCNEPYDLGDLQNRQRHISNWRLGFRWRDNGYSLVGGFNIPSGYLTVCHGKSPFLIGKPSINGPFSMAMLNNQRVLTIIYGIYQWLIMVNN